MDAYKTLSHAGADEIVIKKSRFIGHASPAASEEDAIAFLQSVRQQHREANHNCYAYIIGVNSGIMRYSDDGEPGGTAGVPILEGLKNRGLVNCAVVVTRYFGGILLGAGGLVRAYSQGCGCAVQAAGIVLMEKSLRLMGDIPYPMWDKVSYQLKSQPVILEETQYGACVTPSVMVRERDAAALQSAMDTWTDGQVFLSQMEECYFPWPVTDEEDI